MVERDWAFGISIKLPPQLEGRLLRPGGMEVIDEGILEFPKTLNAIWVVSKQTCHYSQNRGQYNTIKYTALYFKGHEYYDDYNAHD